MSKRRERSELDPLIDAIKRARHEMKRFEKATEYAREQQRKLREEADQ